MRVIKKAYIEITNICNLSCEFCPGTKRDKTYMSNEMFEVILSKLAGKVKYLYFHVMGEPLMHPHLDTFLDIAKKFDFIVNITTNGILINQAMDKLLLKPALRQISFSLHSNKQGHDSENYFGNIFTFAKKLSLEQNKFISLRLWNLKVDKSNADNDNIIIKIAKAFSLDREMLEKWDDNRGIKLAPNIYLNQAQSFEWPSLESKSYGTKGFCQGLRDQIGILCDGRVIPCCLDSEGLISLGNIFTQTLDEVLESPRATSMYEGFSCRNVVEELCQKCGYRQRFQTL